MKRFFVVVFALGFIFAGCAKRAVTTQPEQPGAQQETTQKAIATKEGKTETSKAEATSTAEASKKIATVAVKEVETRGGQAIFENIHFDFDNYDIKDDAKPTLNGIANWLLKNRVVNMLIEGHCDERGTSEYNLALGERRAKSTRDYLVSLGAAKNRLNMISYGKEKPICTGHNEECWQKNRRAQFVIEGSNK